MTPPDVRLLAPAVTAWVVAAVALHLRPGLVLGSAAGAVIAAGFVARRGRWRSSAAAVVIGVLLCGAAAGVAAAVRVHVRTTGVVHDAAVHGSAVTIRGVVLDDPRLAVPKPGSGALVVRDTVVARVRVEQITTGGVDVRVRAPVLVVSADRHWLGLLPSQHVRAEGLLRPADRSDDVAALLSARGSVQLIGRPSRLQRLAGSLRAGLRRAVAPLPAPERGLLPGLVIGDVSALPPALQDDFRTVGLTHLVAVSGDNVSVKQ